MKYLYKEGNNLNHIFLCSQILFIYFHILKNKQNLSHNEY